jgi:putative DNA primase/helicase
VQWLDDDPAAKGERLKYRETNGGNKQCGAKSNSAGDPAADTPPTITVLAGLRHEAADAGLDALAAAKTAFYRRDRDLVRVCPLPAKTASGEETFTPGIVPVTHAVLGRELGRAARWEAFDRHGKPMRVDPPRTVVEQIAAMTGEWPFPILTGVIGTPTMRPDGSLLLAEGYDKTTGLVLLGAPEMPSISEEPTRQEAERALRLLDGLLDEFPFKDGGGDNSVDRAVALSELLTPVLRGAMETAPMHLANAPQPGTGKSYLADIASGISTGERCAVVAFSPNPEETEKRLNGSALGGHPILALDNASGTIESDLLCQITERPLLQLRPLGTSQMVRAANTFIVLANGNNAQVAADMVRRTIECGLDANIERPEARVFRDNPLARIRRDRGRYIAAVLTIARGYLRAGKPGRLPPLASYEAWSDLVRSPLVWLGRADPVNSMADLHSVDPVRQGRVAVFRAWEDELGIGGAYQTSDLINEANNYGLSGAPVHPGLREALLDIARNQRGDVIDPRRLGKWLSKNADNIADGLKLTIDRGDEQRPRWVLKKSEPR